MRLGERVKPFLLATLLTFMVGSYFVSDTFTRGASVERGVPVKVVAEIICVSGSKSERDECGASVAQALVPTNLACLAPVRDLLVCENPTKGEKKGKNRCPEEKKRFSECLQAHLEPQLHRRGFSNEEIARLDLGNNGLRKQPSPDGGGGGEGNGQGGKGQGGDKRNKGSGGGQQGKEEGGGSGEDAAGGKKPIVEVVPGADGGGDEDGTEAGPKVEVVEGPKDNDGNSR
eukprot:jgi/Undpi1/14067/HiC_scaffold_9.g03718.m1